MPGKLNPLLDDSEYAYATGRVRALEARLIDAARLSHMVDAPSVDEASRYLAETEYGGAWEPGAQFKDIILSLHQELARTYREAYEYVPEAGVVDMFALRHLFEGFKVVMKASQEDLAADAKAGSGETGRPRAADRKQAAGDTSNGAGLEAAFMIVTSDFLNEHPGELREFLGKMAAYGVFGDLPGEFRDALSEAYKARSEGMMGSAIDLILDRSASSLSLSMAKKKRNDLLIELWTSWIDMMNLNATLRVKARAEGRAKLATANEAASEGVGSSPGAAFPGEPDLSMSNNRRGAPLGDGRGAGERDRFSMKVLLPGGAIPKEKYATAYGLPWHEIPAVFSGDTIATVCREGIDGYLAEGSFSKLEKEIDDRILGFVKKFRHVSMGAEVVAGYLLAKEFEIKNLRLIMFGKMYGSSSDSIRERLRDING